MLPSMLLLAALDEALALESQYFTAASIASYYPFMQSFLEGQMKSWVKKGEVQFH